MGSSSVEFRRGRLDVEVRSVSADDLPLLLSEMPDDQHDNLYGHVEKLADHTSGRITYCIAWHDGLPVGYGYVQWHGFDTPELKAMAPNEPSFSGLRVKPEFWGRGVGSTLQEHREQLVLERGFKSVVFGVDPSNKRALRLYEFRGYKPIEDRPIAVSFPYLDSSGERVYFEQHIIVMRRQLA